MFQASTVLLRSTPYVTGTSVLGVTYKDGVMLAADTLGVQQTKGFPASLQGTFSFCVRNLFTLLNLTDTGAYAEKHAGWRRAGSYGSTKRYKSFERLVRVNDATALGAGGELSDFQYIQTLLEELATEDYCADDGIQLTPREVYAYLSRVLYNRRNKHAAPATSTARYLHAPALQPIHCFPLSQCQGHEHVCRSKATQQLLECG